MCVDVGGKPRYMWAQLTPQHDIQRKLFEGYDLKFGANMLSAFGRRKYKKALILLWLLMVLTSVPVHLTLNAVIGYASLRIDPGVVEDVHNPYSSAG